MDVQVIFPELIRCLRIHEFHKADRNLYGFFHHITKLSGNLNLAGAFCHHCLNKQNLSACSRPCQSGHNTRLFFFQYALVPNRFLIQKILQPLRIHRDAFLFSFYKFHRRITAQCIHLFLQAPYSRLHRIIMDNGLKRLVCHFQILCLNSHIFHRLWKQMPPCNLEFFHRRISRKLNNFHTVQKRLRYRIRRVCRTDKQYIGKVIRHIQIMVSKIIILLRVQHLQQCTCRVAAEIF